MNCTINDEAPDKTSRMREEFEMGLQDLDDLVSHVDIPELQRINLVGAGETPGGGRCGLYRNNQIWVALRDCASRGYSDYRWRVNRTPHGVVVHEYGHHVDAHTSRPRGLFTPEQTVSSYAADSSKENFAECWRVFVTCPQLLEIRSPERYEWFDERFDSPNEDIWPECLDDQTKIIQKQFREASTNEDLRTVLL